MSLTGVLMEEGRFFLAFEVSSPWNEEPPGRYIKKGYRHLTLIFIGKLKRESMEEISKNIPLPSFKVGPSAIFDKILFLPRFRPNVVAYEVNWLGNDYPIIYQKELLNFFEKNGVAIKNSRPFLSHVTLCRRPFKRSKWKIYFKKLPLYIESLTLFESFENSRYKRIWKREFVPPFVEIEHTADIAFHIRGKNFLELFKNGFIALSFKSPKIINYFSLPEKIDNIDDVIIALNNIITRCDIAIGSDFKAVSFQAKVEMEEKIIKWEMIVDV